MSSLQGNTIRFIDILCGIFYLCWVPVPLIFAGILFFRNKSLFFQFSLTFFLVNLIGFAGYYIYPAAPPWYVAQKGFHFIASTPGNTAGLGRFDAYFGTNIFAGIYSKSSNVFAAMPSLHASYMLIVLYYGIKGKMKWFNLLFALIMLGIWFSAIYTGHHYILGCPCRHFMRHIWNHVIPMVHWHPQGSKADGCAGHRRQVAVFKMPLIVMFNNKKVEYNNHCTNLLIIIVLVIRLLKVIFIEPIKELHIRIPQHAIHPSL